MHAPIRAINEVQVVASKTIEANIAFLRTNLDDVKGDIRELRADNKTLRDKIDHSHAVLSAGQTALRDRIDSVEKTLNQKIEDLGKTLSTELDTKIDHLRKDVDARFDKFSAEVDARFDKFSAEISARFGEVDSRFDKLDTKLSTRIDSVYTELKGEIRELKGEIKGLHEKFDKLAIGFAELRGLHATVLWVCGGFVALVVAAVTIGRAIGWIGPPVPLPSAGASGVSAPLAQRGEKLTVADEPRDDPFVAPAHRASGVPHPQTALAARWPRSVERRWRTATAPGVCGRRGTGARQSAARNALVPFCGVAYSRISCSFVSAALQAARSFSTSSLSPSFVTARAICAFPSPFA